jgi:hypothetical protein
MALSHFLDSPSLRDLCDLGGKKMRTGSANMRNRTVDAGLPLRGKKISRGRRKSCRGAAFERGKAATTSAARRSKSNDPAAFQGNSSTGLAPEVRHKDSTFGG